MATSDKYMQELFTGMIRASGLPVTESEMRGKWEELNEAEDSLIRNDSTFSPFWRLITAIATKPALWLVSLLVQTVLPNSFLRFASGVYLDVYAWGVHLSRKSATFTIGRLVFSRAASSGTLFIPAGTAVETPPIDGTVFRVLTTEDAEIPNGETSVSVPVRAEKEGEAYNLGPGYYSILSVSISGITDVTNPSGWIDVPGADVESDDSLRLRCRNQFAAVGQMHHDAAYAALISAFAGIRMDYLFFEKEAPRGPGTANCHILVESGIPTQEFCSGITQYIMDSGNHGHGDDLLCMPITADPQVLVVTVYPVVEADAERIAALLEEVENRIRCAFRQNSAYSMTKTLPLSRFSFSRLSDELHDALPDLQSIEFNRGTDIVSRLTLPVLESLTLNSGAAA